MQRREWLYVGDAVQGILKVMLHGRLGHIYNISSTEAPTNLEVVRSLCRLVAEEAGLDLARVMKQITLVADRPGHDRLYAVDVAKAKEELHWAPTVPLESGLRMTVQWYLENQQWVERVTSGEYLKYCDAVYGRAWQMAAPETQCETDLHPTRFSIL
jgi:dTDP-glucose 4,6-dehydratase